MINIYSIEPLHWNWPRDQWLLNARSLHRSGTIVAKKYEKLWQRNMSQLWQRNMQNYGKEIREKEKINCPFITQHCRPHFRTSPILPTRTKTKTKTKTKTWISHNKFLSVAGGAAWSQSQMIEWPNCQRIAFDFESKMRGKVWEQCDPEKNQWKSCLLTDYPIEEE